MLTSPPKLDGPSENPEAAKPKLNQADRNWMRRYLGARRANRYEISPCSIADK